MGLRLLFSPLIFFLLIRFVASVRRHDNIDLLLYIKTDKEMNNHTRDRKEKAMGSKKQKLPTIA